MNTLRSTTRHCQIKASTCYVFLVCTVWSLVGCQTPNVPLPIPVVSVTNEQLTADEAKLELQRSWSRQQHVSGLAFELGTANVEICGEDSSRDLGIEWLTLADFPNANLRIAGSQLGVGRLPYVTIVTPHSAAARAGIRNGDMLLTINGEELESAPERYWTYIEINQVRVPTFRRKINRILETAASSGRTVSISVLRERKEPRFDLMPIESCDFRVVVVEDTKLRLENVGKSILVSNSLLDLTHSDGETQIAIAHQLAHILNRHGTKQKRNEMIGGAVGGVAATALLLPVAVASAIGGGDVEGIGELIEISAEASGNIGARMFTLTREQEADYLALYLLERAGIQTDEFLPFWRRIPVDKTFETIHVNIEDRVANIEATSEEIKAKRNAGLPLVPNQENAPADTAR